MTDIPDPKVEFEKCLTELPDGTWVASAEKCKALLNVFDRFLIEGDILFHVMETQPEKAKAFAVAMGWKGLVTLANARIKILQHRQED